MIYGETTKTGWGGDVIHSSRCFWNFSEIEFLESSKKNCTSQLWLEGIVGTNLQIAVKSRLKSGRRWYRKITEIGRENFNCVEKARSEKFSNLGTLELHDTRDALNKRFPCERRT